MKIIDKIIHYHTRMVNGEADTLGEQLQTLCNQAILEGINPLVEDSNWKRFMRRFASNPDQLRRLNGEDRDFNESTWGKLLLAYVPANIICGPDTVGFVAPEGADPRAVGTARFLRTEMIDALDFNLNDEDDPTFDDGN